MMDGWSEDHFEEAKNKLSSLKEDPGNDVKLKIYALFKQATHGPCDTPKPGMLDFINKAKWDSWKSLGSMTQEEARQRYCDLIGSLVAAEGGAAAQAPARSSAGGRTYDSLLVSTQDDITTIVLNRPAKKNAITTQMYEEIIEALQHAARDHSVVTVFTGAGDFYCSGNDLSNFTKIPEGGAEQMAKAGGELLRRYVKAFIDFPKPLVAVVNGPAVGISVTVMGMFDLVYATESATFHTPFSQLGQSPEGCSSYTFPRIMGLGKVPAREPCTRTCALVIDSEAHGLPGMPQLPRGSLEPTEELRQQLIRSVEKERLHAVNDAEVDRLIERWMSDECFNAVMSFFQAKAKL
uniref:Enoyl-CoA delta isomerase 2 n=1 Tax=Hippocampus comes TaxID=109280 RepID=A0A3Q2Z2N8_HIPCM